MNLIDAKIVKKIKREIVGKFPDMKGVEPLQKKIKLKPEPGLFEKLGVSLSKSYFGKDIFQLSFKKLIETEDGFKIMRVVKVLLDKAGKILKITTTK